MKWFERLWDIVWWGSIAVLAFIIVVFAWRAPAVREQQKTAEVVAQILAQRLQMRDVDGTNLPPVPDPALVDKTVEGIDANGNGIRDDVELAIFEKYPDDVKVRAAELQYAMALQNQMTRVFNSGTLVASMKQEGRGYSCIIESIESNIPSFANFEDQLAWLEDERNSELFDEESRRVGQIRDRLTEEVEGIVFDTLERKSKHDENYRRYMTSYGTEAGEECDVYL